MSTDEPPNPTPEQWASLCNTVESLLPEAVGKEAWPLLIATILTTSPHPSLLAPFYSHLTTHHPAFSTPPSQDQLSVRLRDLLAKLTTLIGAPRVLGALIPLAAAQTSNRPSSAAASSTLSLHLQSLDLKQIEQRGTNTIHSIYDPQYISQVFSTFGEHKADFGFLEVVLIYGLYLSEHTVLSARETELCVFACIQCQGLRGPSLWHMRGLGRVLGARGVEEGTAEMGRIKDALRAVKMACAEVVEFGGDEYVRRSGLGVGGWVNVGDVVRELGGWGGD